MTTEITSQRVRANGLDFTCLTAGQGPLVLCLHGFPDTPHGFGDLMTRLAAAGYRVVAPHARFSPPTDAPADADYEAPALGTDVLELITALGETRATLIGHDWGALSAYAAASLDPSRVERMVTVAVPHPRTTKPSASWIAMLLFFQVTPLASALLRRDHGAVIDFIYRKTSPAWNVRPEDTEPYKRGLLAPGGTERALAPYRSAFRSMFRRQARERTQALFARNISTPTLLLTGDRDPAFGMECFANSRAHFDGSFELVTMPGTGHFPHREQPEVFAGHVLRFLGSPGASLQGAAV